jgi:hypothetical protein
MTLQALSTPAPVTFQGNDRLNRTVIVTGTSTPAIDLQTARLAAIQIPSAWTTANLTLEVSADGTTFVPLYDQNGNLVTIVVGGTSRVVQAPLVDLLAYRSIKILSTGSQASPRSIILHLVR